MRIFFFLLSFLLPVFGALAQQNDGAPKKVYGTFYETRLINTQTNKTLEKGMLNFLIQHRFGTFSSGVDNLYGLDEAYARLGFDYGITDRLMVGIGRSSSDKSLDGFLKYRLLWQTEDNKMPLSVSLYGDMSYKTGVYAVEGNRLHGFDKADYLIQVLLSRKFSDRLSLQLIPTFIHKNVVALTDENNTLTAGASGRFALSAHWDLTAEYFYTPNKKQNQYDPVALGVEWETKGHVFQMFLTNSLGIIGRANILETTEDIGNGDIRFGFNINRAFRIAGRDY